MPNRKKPFSGKQKKVQLQLKKQEKGSSRRSESDKGEKEDSELKIAVTSDKNEVSGKPYFFGKALAVILTLILRNNSATFS